MKERNRRDLHFGDRPIVSVFADIGLEFDQRLLQALSMSPDASIDDSHLFHALYCLNSLATRHLEIPEDRYTHLQCARDGRVDPTTVTAGVFLPRVFQHALENYEIASTFGTKHYYRALLDIARIEGDNFPRRPDSLDLIVVGLTGGQSGTLPLSELPGALRLLEDLERASSPEEDFQFFLGLDGGRLVFRVASILNDFVQESSTGLFLPQRAVLSHFQDQFGGFTAEEIEELELLINDQRTSEADFQHFFEAHPHFLRLRDHREVHSHVVLTRPETHGPLIPDFILTDLELQRAAIAELKLPGPKLIRRQTNRDRFASAVMEARAQLLTYREWFREKTNRQRLVGSVGMEIYEPSLIAIIGRSSEFVDSVDRQRLRADNPDIEVVTFDDILRAAKRRRMQICGSDRGT